MDFSSRATSKDAKICCRRAYAFDSLAARQEGQIRTRFYKANICIYFDKFPRNIRILLRKFVLPILNICSSKTQRPSSLNFKMILVLAECRQVRTLQARQVPKALKIQASGRIRICPSCLIPILSVKASQLDRLGNVCRADHLAALQIRYGARHAHDAVIASGGKPHTVISTA